MYAPMISRKARLRRLSLSPSQTLILGAALLAALRTGSFTKSVGSSEQTRITTTSRMPTA